MTVGEVLPMRMTCHQALDGESRMLPDADHHARNLHTHRPLALLRQLYARSIAASGNRKGLVCLRRYVLTLYERLNRAFATMFGVRYHS